MLSSRHVSYRTARPGPTPITPRAMNANLPSNFLSTDRARSLNVATAAHGRLDVDGHFRNPDSRTLQRRTTYLHTIANKSSAPQAQATSGDKSGILQRLPQVYTPDGTRLGRSYSAAVAAPGCHILRTQPTLARHSCGSDSTHGEREVDGNRIRRRHDLLVLYCVCFVLCNKLAPYAWLVKLSGNCNNGCHPAGLLSLPAYGAP